MSSITKYIKKKLGLKVNAEKRKVTRPKKTKYLSFSFWKDTKGRWKAKSHIKALRQLGVKPDIVYNLSHTSKGHQLIAKTDWLKFAINNNKLRKIYIRPICKSTC